MRWIKRRVHVSWLLAAFCIGFMIGVALVPNFGLTGVPTAWLVCAVLLVFVCVIRPRIMSIVLIVIAGLIIGIWRGSLTNGSYVQYHPYFGQDVLLSGVIVSDPEEDTKGSTVIKLTNVQIHATTIEGIVRITASPSKAARGDTIEVKGVLSEGFGTYPAAMRRAVVIKVIQPQPGDIARQVRDWFAAAVRSVIPDPQASLGLGFLVGQKSALPTELIEALQIAGLTHIVVASGYNLTILVRLARRAFEKVSKYLSFTTAGLMIVSFIAVTGLSPSMSRAGLVAGLSLIAWYYGRRFHPIALLAYAMAVTVAVQPSFAWGDLGWQLSFLAFAGVMIVAPILQRYFFGETKPGTIRQILGETIAAHLVTVPLIIFVFGTLSHVAIFSNLLVLPLVPLAMLLTFLSGIGALLLPSVGSIIALPASWLLQYMTTVTQTVATLPWAQSELKLEWWVVGLIYAGMIVVVIYLWRVSGYNLRSSNIVE